jgi:hypothetical protein
MYALVWITDLARQRLRCRRVPVLGRRAACGTGEVVHLALAGVSIPPATDETTELSRWQCGTWPVGGCLECMHLR